MAGGTRLPPRAFTQTWRSNAGRDSTRTFYSQEAFDRYQFNASGFDFQGGLQSFGLTNDMSDELAEALEDFREDLGAGLANVQVKLLECGHRYNVAHTVLTGAFAGLLRDPVAFPSGPPNVTTLSDPQYGMPCFAIDPSGRLEGIYSPSEATLRGGQLNSWGSDPAGNIAGINSRGQWFVPFDVNNVLASTTFDADRWRYTAYTHDNIGSMQNWFRGSDTRITAFGSGRVNQRTDKDMSVVMDRDGLRYYVNFLLASLAWRIYELHPNMGGIGGGYDDNDPSTSELAAIAMADMSVMNIAMEGVSSLGQPGQRLAQKLAGGSMMPGNGHGKLGLYTGGFFSLYLQWNWQNPADEFRPNAYQGTLLLNEEEGANASLLFNRSIGDRHGMSARASELADIEGLAADDQSLIYRVNQGQVIEVQAGEGDRYSSAARSLVRFVPGGQYPRNIGFNSSNWGMNGMGGHGTQVNHKFNLPNLTQLIDQAADAILAGTGELNSSGTTVFAAANAITDPTVGELAPLARAMKQMVARITPQIPVMEEQLGCINDALQDLDEIYEDFDEELDDMEDDAEAAADEFLGFTWEDDAFMAALDDIQDYADEAVADGNALEEMAQQENPARIFFREQCYLLGYIQQFANARKDNDLIIDYNNMQNSGHYPAPNAGGYSTMALQYLQAWPGPLVTRNFAADSEYLKSRNIPNANGDTWQAWQKRVPYTKAFDGSYGGNACLLIDGDPYGLLNRLVCDSRTEAYMNIDNHLLSYLQPKIRLFKVVYNDDDMEQDVEIKFDTHFSSRDMAAYMRGQRSSGVGVKSFEFTYDGTNPFSAKKSIKATLKIYANTFDDLMECRGAGQCDTPESDGFLSSYRYVDLALKTFSRSQLERASDACDDVAAHDTIFRENQNLQKLNFRLKAHVGVELPHNKELIESLSSRELNKLGIAINASCVTLNFTPTVHLFDIDDMGRVTFTINYLAYVEDFYDSPAFNVFANPEITMQRLLRTGQIREMQATCEDERLDELKEEMAIEAGHEFKRLLSSMMSSLINKQKMKYVNVDYEEMRFFVMRGPYSSDDIDASRHRWAGWGNNSPIQTMGGTLGSSRFGQNLDDALDIFVDSRRSEDEDEPPPSTDDPSPQERIALALNNGYNTTIPFFYIADLIDIVMENVENEITQLPQLIENFLETNANAQYACILQNASQENQRYAASFKKMRIVLGPVEFVGAKSAQQSAFVNLGDIPISAKYFLEWMTSKYLTQNEFVYSLSKFISDVVNNLVNQFLNGTKCPVSTNTSKVRLQQTTVVGQSPEAPYNDLTSASNYVTDVPIDALTYEAVSTGASRFLVSRHPGPQPILNPSGFSGASVRTTIPSNREVNYMIYFVGQTMPTDRMKGNKFEDESRGIFHYLLGRDRGLIKTIKLQKTSTPGLAEVRFEQDGYDGLQQLRVVYDADIETFANVNTFPGCYIYIEPEGFSPSAPANGIELTKYGIGGYYMIIKSSHLFANGKLESNIKAKWVNQLDAEVETSHRADDEPGQDGVACATAYSRYDSARQDVVDLFGGAAVMATLPDE